MSSWQSVLAPKNEKHIPSIDKHHSKSNFVKKGKETTDGFLSKKDNFILDKKNFKHSPSHHGSCAINKKNILGPYLALQLCKPVRLSLPVTSAQLESRCWFVEHLL
jgi:hypothetical protein